MIRKEDQQIVDARLKEIQDHAGGGRSVREDLRGYSDIMYNELFSGIGGVEFSAYEISALLGDMRVNHGVNGLAFLNRRDLFIIRRTDRIYEIQRLVLVDWLLTRRNPNYAGMPLLFWTQYQLR